MRRPRRRTLTSSLRAVAGRHRSDEGVTLVETIVAITLIGLVMTALITFFIGSVRSTSNYRKRQVATQLGDQALEKLRATTPDKVAAGRDMASEATLYGNRVALLGYDPDVADMAEYYDLTAKTGQGATALATTKYDEQVVGGVHYFVYYEIGVCWQAVSSTAPGDCKKVSPAPADTNLAYVKQYRVIIAVHYPATGQVCTSIRCRYVTQTLVNPRSPSDQQPVFNNSSFRTGARR